MSYQHISTRTVKKARKNHECMSCFHLLEFIRECAPFNAKDRTELQPFFETTKMTEEDQLIVIDRKKKGFQILKGESYEISTGNYDGDLINSKYNAEIHAVCTKYDIYPEWD